MVRQIISYSMVFHTLAWPALADGKVETIAPDRPPYLAEDGAIDGQMAVKVARMADCGIAKAADDVEASLTALTELSIKLEIRLAQVAAYRKPPTASTTPSRICISHSSQWRERRHRPRGSWIRPLRSRTRRSAW